MTKNFKEIVNSYGYTIAELILISPYQRASGYQSSATMAAIYQIHSLYYEDEISWVYIPVEHDMSQLKELREKITERGDSLESLEKFLSGQ